MSLAMFNNQQDLEVVAIDGPAGVGKSTVSRMVAAALGFSYLDTGAMYRAVALYLEDLGVDYGDREELSKHLNTIQIELLPASSFMDDTGVIINGVDLSGRIRNPEASMIASRVSSIDIVRSTLTELQRSLGGKGCIVAEGRDMGTVVFPAAKYKFFLDAEPEVRAQRRCDQLEAKSETVRYEEILAQTVQRDKNDTERAIAPLKKADDAHLVDTGNKSVDAVVSLILKQIEDTPH